MSSPSELSLDVKPHGYSMLLKSFGDQTDQAQKLEEFLARLEEERRKIDAFKRELPVCIQLLSNAMEASKQQLQSYRANQGQRPVLEEFIPIKHSSSEEDSEKALNMSDKANWMTSAQLWSQASHDEIKQQSTTNLTSPNGESEVLGFGVSPKLGLDTKQRNCGAFLPFSKERNSCPSPCLALASAGSKEMEEMKISVGDQSAASCKGGGNGAATIEQGGGGNPGETQPTGTATTNQNHRKARRCWSPDLHRRFVNALQMLGGSQVATPKQIRELMKVDGLTNDEVKSHLQKYRLHTRRPSPSPQAPGAQTPQLVVLGGIWVPPEYATAAHGGGPTALYSVHHPTAHGHHASQHYCAPPVPQEFYHGPPPQLQHHHHTLHHQLQMYKSTSPAGGSPDSDGRGVGNRSESIEDGKSESGSWKGDSGGENGGGERKATVGRREDGEESNGSEITLKF